MLATRMMVILMMENRLLGGVKEFCRETIRIKECLLRIRVKLKVVQGLDEICWTVVAIDFVESLFYYELFD